MANSSNIYLIHKAAYKKARNTGVSLRERGENSHQFEVASSIFEPTIALVSV